MRDLNDTAKTGLSQLEKSNMQIAEALKTSGFVVPPDQPEALLQQLPAALALDRLAIRRQAERRFGLEAFGARLEAWINQAVATA